MTDNGVRPCGSSPAPCRRVSPEQRAVWEARGRRSLEFGAAWLIGGLLITAVIYGEAEGAVAYFVAGGPTLYGVHRIVAGLQLLSRSRKQR
ncbi:hypothetical protein SLINC_1060 [Streptomyces lincolnensis]|uniref:Uncharacterized protein n=1 Tax=Streptomyces lincolnensis TaxID=1915 RepID=A0A1B1M473_STRLN|nr:hypothetical protein [Streptomyces lincolnensis]ANS63284.1 hypothetical protein SLINC_1060 [Streptomyces lincolnensis]AXG52206.1 hypothetical protein SLCG_1051 [Streptomyces lincolnensis]QMV05181.1 hypothetical protein GJU35_05610 [Streptomyces lincolnensis]